MAKITKKISVLEAQAYLHKLVSSDVTKSFHFSLKIQSSILVQPLFWYLVSSAMYCKSYSFTCMNNELAKYLCTFYNWITSHPTNTVILPLK